MSPVISKLKLYLSFWGFLIIVFTTIIYMQINNHAKLSAEIDSLNLLIKEASAKEHELQQTIDFNKSDEFVINYAHNEFGFVFSNEVIIYNNNYKLIR